MLGSANALYFHYELRPIIYRTLQKPKMKHFKFTLLIAIIFLAQIIVIYFYVDSFVPIPQNWITQIRILCNNARKTSMFHYNGLAYEGYIMFLPIVYYFRVRMSDLKQEIIGNKPII